MARYTGPKQKKARAFGEAIYGPSKAFERKKYRPGQHGTARRRGQKSDYSNQLMEKQKAKYTYGLLEKQFRNLFAEASRKGGVTGEVLLQLLESRLDNTVYRLGLARTRRQARQLVSHRHITVNGRLLNIPSVKLKPGDIVGAIANEIKLDSSYIGQINLCERHSFVQLPKGMPDKSFAQLKRVRVRRQALEISVSDGVVPTENRGRRSERSERPRKNNS